MPQPANPFVYGEVVPKSAFVGRKAELDRLVADLADGQKVFLISPRRYGKSSLIRHAFSALGRDRIDTLEVTVSSFSSYVAFLEGYVRALAGLDARDQGRSWLRDLFTTFTPELRADRAAGGLAVSFPAVRTPRDAARLGAEVFALPGRVAARRGRRLVIAMDEFQAVTGYDAGNVEQTLRAAVQLQRQVGYVFAGSEPSLMEQMVSSRRPFYKAGPIVRLGRIPADAFSRFIDDRFKKSGLTPEPGLGAGIVDVAGNLPYDVQRLAHETWDDAMAARARAVSLEDVHQTLHRLLAEQEIFFESLWQRLTLAQRAVLRAVVLDHGHEILGADVRTRYRLGGASSVQTSLAALQRLDLIAREDDGRYAMVDSLMREWVARRTY
ncbi:MAG TPA: ATP-binding protein [Vicinamibacterales bacterium]|nr:ATP-binding protein [Vicinamibacterales bacterium]